MISGLQVTSVNISSSRALVVLRSLNVAHTTLINHCITVQICWSRLYHSLCVYWRLLCWHECDPKRGDDYRLNQYICHHIHDQTTWQNYVEITHTCISCWQQGSLPLRRSWRTQVLLPSEGFCETNEPSWGRGHALTEDGRGELRLFVDDIYM